MSSSSIMNNNKSDSAPLMTIPIRMTRWDVSRERNYKKAANAIISSKRAEALSVPYHPKAKHNAAAKKDVNMLSVMVMEYVYKGRGNAAPMTNVQ